MKQALALKYRPKTLNEVVAQDVTVKLLKRAVETRNFKHAYLFAGDSGCGKTTISRCFANAINQGLGQPIEIDAASNNGVDQVRLITESAAERSLDSEYKIFIIDECHAITSAGWQAFLKSLEEPPMYTIYIFCTTEPSKVPATILNRVQRYNISKISAAEICKRLKLICLKEGFSNYEATCELISKISQGRMRDAITYLDQCADLSTDLSLDNVRAVLTGFSFETMFKLTWALQEGNEGEMLSIIDSLSASGQDLKRFISLYMSFILDLAKYSIFKDISVTNIPAYLASQENPVVQETTKLENATEWFNALTDLLLTIKLEIRYDTSYETTIKAFLLKACRGA